MQVDISSVRPPRQGTPGNSVEALPSFGKTESHDKVLIGSRDFSELEKLLKVYDRLNEFLAFLGTLWKAECARLNKEINTDRVAVECNTALHSFPGPALSTSTSGSTATIPRKPRANSKDLNAFYI